MRPLMSSRSLGLFGVIALVGVARVHGQSQASSDREAVTQAVLDYVEGIYEVKPERIQRSVHPTLKKVGYGRESAHDPYEEWPMTFEQLVALAGEWNADGHLPLETAIKEVVVFDVLDQTATARLTADWGIDHMQLAKKDGRWQIIHILWQSHPPE